MALQFTGWYRGARLAGLRAVCASSRRAKGRESRLKFRSFNVAKDEIAITDDSRDENNRTLAIVLRLSVYSRPHDPTYPVSSRERNKFVLFFSRAISIRPKSVDRDK